MRSRHKHDGAVGVREVLGVPVLPPAAATTITTRVRAALASMHRSMAPPPMRILESLFGLLDHAALVALCDLDVPDRLDRRMPVDTLAAIVAADRDAFDRLVRYAATRGWLRIDRRDRVAPTRTTRFLARAHPGGWRGWVEFVAGGEVTAAAGRLASVVRTGDDAFAAVNGSSFFDWYAGHPDRAAAFDAAMAAGGRMHGLVLARTLEWSRDHVVCDVGGGDGSLLHALLAMQPHLSGVLLDLPSVVERVRAHIAERIEVVAGDAFTAVPPGATTYLLVNVIHDWSDADAVRLLARIAADAAATSRIVVVEGRRRPRPVDDVTQRTDLLMLLLAPGGHERSVDEIVRLAAGAGLRVEAAVPLGSGDVAHVLRRVGPIEGRACKVVGH